MHKDEIFRFMGKITNPLTGRKVKAYFTSVGSRKEAKRQDEREKTKNKKERKIRRKWGLR